MPVLAVDEVPELDRVRAGRSPRAPSSRARRTTRRRPRCGRPRAATACAASRSRGGARSGSSGRSRSRGPCAGRRPRSPGRVRPPPLTAIVSAPCVERHRAAAPGARALVVVAAQVVAEAVELGVHARAVQALGVVLDDRLPVGLDVVVDPGGALEVRRCGRRSRCSASAPTWSASGGACAGRRRRTRGRRASPCGSRRRPLQAGSKSSSSSVCGRVLERAVEAVAPGVVRALEAARGALALGDQPRAAVAADVVEAALADEQQALARDLGGHEVAALRRRPRRGRRRSSRRGRSCAPPSRRRLRRVGALRGAGTPRAAGAGWARALRP